MTLPSICLPPLPSFIGSARAIVLLCALLQRLTVGCIAGLTPAQVQLLMNAPAHQVNALAAQLGMLDTGARPGSLPNNLGAPAPSLAANQALLQQQKLAAARASYANQQAQAQRAPANPMIGLQQPPQQPLMGLQQARQVGSQCCQARPAYYGATAGRGKAPS